ncbi:MerR family transcriptional regulator [Nocardiopsis halophila]|uniref:MerR family transcriptional regulator n=1 Tax=Nocardiopsis halophila TaxID=141692 RepID=UPI000369BB63|nr:MerR family transcriptional regulator [Nocardiopsis halophila]
MEGGGHVWKVGELARATGLTVRALHHYDGIGLVRPSERTASGHRLYTEADVRLLYRALALRDLGLPLEEVRSVLQGGGPGLDELLTGQLAQVERRIAALGGLRGRLSAVLQAARGGSAPESERLMRVIEGMSSVDETVRAYFGEERLRELQRRRHERGEEAVGADIAAWPELIAAVGRAVEDGTDPASDEGRELARRWMALLESFHGGDDGLKESLYRMREGRAEEITAGHGGPTQEMIDFVARANEARNAG